MGGANGTGIAKYQPLMGTETIAKNNTTQTVTTSQHCITAMKEYENYSIEELRFDDYAANRKAAQAGSAPTGLFGSPGPSNTGIFGAQPTQQPPAFGQTENKGLFGQPTSTLGGFGQAQSAFGANNNQNNSLFKGFSTPATSAPAFGFNNTATNNTTNSVFKSFGTPANTGTGLFGQPQATSTGVFGQPAQPSAFGSTFGQQNTNTGTGLFGNTENKPAFGAPATSTSFNFASNTGGLNTGGGLFGQSKPADFGTNTFGTATAAAPAFGAAQPTQSLFGNSFGAKPAAAPFQGFGTQQQPAPLGSTLGTATGGLFGNNTAQKPGGLFGNTGNTLGQTGSMFGGFNNANTGQSTLGQTTLGMSSFGAQQPQQQASVPIHQQILAMTTNPYGDNPIFKDLKPVSNDDSLKPTNPAAQKAVLEANAAHFKVSSKAGSGVKVKPVGVVAGDKKSLFDGLEEYDSSVDSFSMKPSAKRLNIKSKPGSLNDSLNGSRTFLLNTSDVAVCGTPRRNPGNKENEESFDNQIPRQREAISGGHEASGRDSWIQSNALEKARNAAVGGRHGEATALSSTIHELVTDRAGNRPSASGTLDNSLNVSAKMGDLSHRSGATFVSQASSLDSLASRTFNPDETNVDLVDPYSIHPTGIVLKRAGYYTIPSLDELCSYLSEDGSCWVDNFTIGREGYGNVYFNERMDVTNLNLDEIVFFRNKEVVIYPMDDHKPPIGQGLNRRAQITLDQVWPTDKTTHEAIKDPERLQAMDYEGKLRRTCYKHETRFMDYRPETGSWVFKVDHFSKYGLSDSDEEDEPQEPKKAKMGVQLGKKAGPEANIAKTNLLPLERSSLPKQQMPQEMPQSQEAVNRTVEGLDSEDDQFDEDYEPPYVRKVDVTSPSGAVASGCGVDAHKLQLMKASFFVDDDAEEEEDDRQSLAPRFNFGRDTPDQTVPNHQFSRFSSMQSLFRDSSVTSMKTMLSENTNKTSTTIRETMVENDTIMEKTISLVNSQPVIPVAKVAPLIIRPKIHEVRTGVVVLPDEMSIMGRKSSENCFVDMTLLFGRKFKIGFGGQNKMTFMTNVKDSELLQGKGDLPNVARLFHGRSVNNLTWPLIANVKISTKYEIRDFPETVQEHLKIQLNFSTISLSADSCPYMTVAGGTHLLLSHFEQASAQAEKHDEEYTKYTKSVWSLCMALWGDDECLEGQEVAGHLSMMRRRELVSQWLEEVIAQRRGVGKSREDYLSHLLELLFAHKVEEACELAFNNDDVNLSLLLSQISGGPTVRQLVQHQLSCWQDVEADAFIDAKRMKAYMLVAGTPLLTSTNGIINVFSDTDWITGLAIHLWYLCSPTLSVTDALMGYEQDFSSADDIVAAPYPPYITDYRIESDKPIRDIRFHLLKLYSKRSHRMEALLNPATHTTDCIDFRLSWFLLQTLKTLGYRHCSPLAEAQLTTSFASQLEQHGLWQWAIFVLMHLGEEGCRAATIKDILNRFIRLNGEKECTKQYQEMETFVSQDLKVPSEWIYYAKAVRAGVFDRHHDQVKFYLKAKEYSMAHDILMEKIAPDYIINGKRRFVGP